MGIRVWTRHLCILLIGAMSSLAMDGPRAAEWSMEPSVDLRTEYNDNILFTSAPHGSVWGLIVSPDVKFSGSTETLNVTGGLRFNFNRYSGERELDTNDHVLSLRSSYKAERDIVGLNVDSVRDSTLMSELAETGVVLARQQRSLFAVNPSWSRSLTEATTLAATYSYSDARYAHTATTGAIDYQDQTATVGLQSKLSERDSASVTAYFARYENVQSRANTYGLQVGYDREISETLRGSVTAGTRNTRSTVFSQALFCDGPIIFGACAGNVITLTSSNSRNSTGYIFSGNLEKKWETGAISGTLSHDINPSGVGALVETDRVGLNWTGQWAPTVSSSVAAAAYETRNIGGQGTSSKSRYYTIEPRVSWKISEWWTLSVGYSYQRVKYVDNPADATTNIAYAILNYTWPKFSVSR